MRQYPRCLAPVVLALAMVAAWGCDADDRLDEGAGDADTDSDADADADADTDTDTCAAAPCDCYPEGPYRWFENNVVSPVEFPARYGPHGPDTTLHMCDAHAGSADVKSLVFAVGSNS